MKKLLDNRYFKYIVLFINFVIYIVLISKQYIFGMSYIKSIIFILINSIFLYIVGIYINKKNIYEENVLIYILLYFVSLISLTFFIGRASIGFYNWWYASQLKPFYTIINQFRYGSNISFIKNILGNSFLLVPLSFLLMVRNDKYKNIFRQLVIILPVIILIEVLQAFTHTGSFDIDDIILNYFGTVVFTFIITRFNLIDYIKIVFYTDFKLNNNIKKILLILSIFFIVLVDIILLWR